MVECVHIDPCLMLTNEEADSITDKLWHPEHLSLPDKFESSYYDTQYN